jgi:lysyl-tRNA synthetase class 1
MENRSLFWADRIARKIISEIPDKERYVCAAGITPSGTVHIGNFREIITVDIVARALKDAGKKVRFIYSWDDYDRLRKVPKNVPASSGMEKHLMMPIVDVPDPWGCHKSYAEHFEKAVEDRMPEVGISPEFIRQSIMYRKCAYQKEIKTALEKRKEIADILNNYRKEPLPADWYPVRVYCKACGKETTKVVAWDSKYEIEYVCECGKKEKIDFRKEGNAKLPWRVDWPMRWHYEKVDFEPGGKEHSAPGGSRTTSEEIVKKVYNTRPPVYQMYDFVILGEGGKISSSLGNVITLDDVLKVYTPEILRFYFAGTKPIKEFSFMFGEDVFKIYEDFYKVERVYFGKEKAEEKISMHLKRVYEMSCVSKPPKKLSVQPGFRKCIDLLNTYGSAEEALKKAKESEGLKSKEDTERYRAVLEKARNWIGIYASEKYKANVAESVPEGILSSLSAKQKAALKAFAKGLEKSKTEDDIKRLCSSAAESAGISPNEFFRAAYLVILGKERGPRLAPFILAAGKERVARLLGQIK